MRLFYIFPLSILLLSCQAYAIENKSIYGFVEKVTLVQKGITIPAKLDTGAKSASLNAIHIKKKTLNNKPYLSVDVPTQQGNISFTCEYLGEVQIKARTEESKFIATQDNTIARPMVLMRLKLGNKTIETPVNLTGRGHFVYPMLLGRETIRAFKGIVDPSKKFLFSHPALEAQ